MRLRPSVVFLSLLSSTTLGLLFVSAGSVSPKPPSIKTISLFKLMGEKAWMEYKHHVESCEVCSSLDDQSRYKMCGRSYYLSDAARPMLTNDQLRLIALGRLKISND